MGDAANTKRPIEILTSPNTDVALLDKDGATMGTGRTNETGHVTIIPQQWIPKGDVSAKATWFRKRNIRSCGSVRPST